MMPDYFCPGCASSCFAERCPKCGQLAEPLHPISPELSARAVALALAIAASLAFVIILTFLTK